MGFLGLAAVEGGFTFLSGVLASQTAEGVTRRLRNFLYDHIQHFSFTYHSKTPTGELIERSTSDVDALRRFFSDQAISVGRIILLFIVNFIALLNLNTKLALISIIVIPLVLVVSIVLFKNVTKSYESYQEQEARFLPACRRIWQVSGSLKPLPASIMKWTSSKKTIGRSSSAARKLIIMQSLFWPLSDILCGAQLLGGYLVGALMAINGEITVGTYLAYAGMVVYIIYPLRNLGRVIVQTSTGMVSYGRVMDIIKETREPLEQGDYLPQNNVKGAISFENVAFEYEPGDHTLSILPLT